MAGPELSSRDLHLKFLFPLIIASARSAAQFQLPIHTQQIHAGSIPCPAETL